MTLAVAVGEAQEERDKLSQQALNAWTLLESGLEFGVFSAPIPSESGDSLIRILRIHPDQFEFRLLNASATPDREILTAKEWSQRYQLVAAINASMYQADYLPSTSLMRTKNHVNNPNLTKDKTILAFHPKSSKLPPVMILDRQCENFDDWMPQYATLIQSIRMISCKGSNVWRHNPEKRWSIAAIGTDKNGNVLFIHSRSQYSTNELNSILLALPIQIGRAMYVEGGREAQLYIKSGGYECELVGMYGMSGFNPYNGARPIPNIVGIVRKPS